MSSAIQNRPLLRSVTQLALLGGISASFAWACVSSGGDNKGGGGTAGDTGGTAGTDVGGNTSNGGGSAGGTGPNGGAASTLPACNLASGVVTGNACSPTPSKLFTIQDNTPGTGATGTSCPIAVWANDGTSSGYFFLPWCNTAGANPSDCTLSMACSGGAIHITGTYLGQPPATIDGNAGFGLNLQTTFPEAGPGCQMIGGTGLTGVTIDVTNTTIPSNTLLVGLTLANGNAVEHLATLTAGAQTLKIPWAGFETNKNKCGDIPGPGIVAMYFAFQWFNDGAAHTVDATMSNFGFY